MTFDTILVDDDGPVCTITLNRPEKRNAMNPAMQEELIAAMNEAASSECRVVVFKGAGQCFCSGLDLSVLRQMGTRSEREHRADAERVAKLFRTLYELPKPTVAAVHGAALAGGTGLATICDFTVAADTAKFGYTEVRIGFVPAVVSAFLTVQIGDKRSRELLLTGRMFDANEAWRLGLIHEVCAAEDLAARVRSLIEVLVTNSPMALEATKRLLVGRQNAWLDAAVDAALIASAEARSTTDFSEGIAAFLEKRKPEW